MTEEIIPLKDLFDEACKKHKINRSPYRGKPHKEQDTGFFRTRKIYCQSCTQKFTYRYRWFDEEKKKKRVLTCIDLQGLRDKVRKKDLEWSVESYYKASKTAREVGLPLSDLK